MILLTFAAALALPFYSVGIFMIHPFVLPIYNFIVYFPLAAILVYIGRGRTLPMSSAEVARLEDKRRRAEYTAGWNRVRMWGWEEPNWQGKLK